MQQVLEVSPDRINEVVKPLMNKKINYKEILTEPNVFGNSYLVAECYLLKLRDWSMLKGSHLYEIFKELIIFLRSSKQLKIDFDLKLA